MFLKNWKRELFTIPNLLSLFRILLIPVYIRLYQNATELRHVHLTGLLVACSCLTDLADGLIARHFQMVSNVGKVLDPLADKLTQLGLILCLCPRYRLLYPVLALFIMKELFQLFLFMIYIRKGLALPGALYAGKICTGVLFGSLLIMILTPAMRPLFVKIMILTDIFFLLLSFGSYVLAYLGEQPKLRNIESEY